jgi:hypothetical protein
MRKTSPCEVYILFIPTPLQHIFTIRFSEIAHELPSLCNDDRQLKLMAIGRIAG